MGYGQLSVFRFKGAHEPALPHERLREGVFDCEFFAVAIDGIKLLARCLVTNAATFDFDDDGAKAWMIQNEIDFVIFLTFVAFDGGKRSRVIDAPIVREFHSAFVKDFLGVRRENDLSL